MRGLLQQPKLWTSAAAATARTHWSGAQVVMRAELTYSYLLLFPLACCSVSFSIVLWDVWRFRFHIPEWCQNRWVLTFRGKALAGSYGARQLEEIVSASNRCSFGCLATQYACCVGVLARPSEPIILASDLIFG